MIYCSLKCFGHLLRCYQEVLCGAVASIYKCEKLLKQNLQSRDMGDLLTSATPSEHSMR